MKILLVGDIHVGVKIDSTIFLNTFERFFLDFLTKIVKEEKIDEIYILGDLFDNRNNISVKTSNLVYDVFSKFLSLFPNLKINIILGNHDIYYKNTRKVNSIKNLELIGNIRVVSNLYRRTLEDGRIIIEVPWLINQGEIDEFSRQKGDICLGHLEINGFEMIPGFIERKGISDTLLRNNFLRVFSGHFHLRKEMNGITYVGNPYPTKWTDSDNTKGVYILDTKNLNSRFIEFEDSPKYKKIYLSMIKKKLQNLKEEVGGNFVSLILDDDISPKALDKLSDVIARIKPLSFSIVDKEKVFVDDNSIDLECLSPVEYLIEYINVNIKDNKTEILELVNSLYNEIKEY